MLGLHFYALIALELLNKVGAIPGLVLPVERTTGLGCIPEGRTVSYECTVTDTSNPVIGSTIWLGSVFNCPVSSNRISLSHPLYGSGESELCGNWSTMSVGFIGNEYTSRLTLTATTGLDGTMVNCTLSGVTLVGSDTIRVGVLPPPPWSIVITFTSGSEPSSYDVSWNHPSGPVESGVGGYMFCVTGEECGCVDRNVSVDTTSVTCSGWSASGQTCSFEVRTLSLDCGFTSEPVMESLVLSVPELPKDITIRTKYLMNGNAQSINLDFPGDAPTLGTNLDSSVRYTVKFAGSSIYNFTGVLCNSTNHCTLRVNGSQLSPNDKYIVSVMASNVFGSGITATYPTEVVTNSISQKFVRVFTNERNYTVSCNLLSSFPQTDNLACSIRYGPSSENCELFTDSSIKTTGHPGDISSIFLTNVNTATEFCYTVYLNYGSTALSFVGIFTPVCDPEVLGDNPTSLSGPGSVSVPNGVVNYEGLAHSSIARLFCNGDYMASKESNDRTCLYLGGWSGSPQQCIQEVSGLSTEGTIVLSVVLTFLVTLVLGVSIGVVSVSVYIKCRRRTDQSSSQPPTELREPMYEEPENLPDPRTRQNAAYGHMQPLSSS